MEREEYPVACTIAGSDSGGGAGIQADLKTFTALGVWGCTVITALTAQNPVEVRGSWTVPPGFVRLQLEAVQDEFSIRAYKTGMLGTAAVVHEVAESLPASAVLVIDPVMVATSGAPLLDADGKKALIEELLPASTLATPNIPEACAIAGMRSISTPLEMARAADAIREMGAGAVLVKGGHLAGGESVDVLVDSEGTHYLEGVRYPFAVHGTGCCLSAAITAYLARGLTLREACRDAKIFIDTAISSGPASRSGRRMADPSAHAKRRW
jgi:hydroxymethylpyrimidine/phosphomethylpyrimidine kinase